MTFTNKTEVDGNELRFDSGVSVRFEYPIGEAVEFDRFVVVRLDVLGRTKTPYNENVFGVTMDGVITWQIEKVKHVDAKSPYVTIGRQDDTLVLHNWDGTIVVVDPVSGTILRKMHGK